MSGPSDPPGKLGAPRTVISVDAMGGDRGPVAVVAGCALSARVNPEIRFLATRERA